MRRKNIFLDNITITDVAAEGKAIAKEEGKVIFIEGAIPGDVVNIRLTKSKKDWAEAVVTKIITASTHRITPFCQHFSICGGCKWQMLPYTLQLEYKQNEVAQNLKRLGKIDLPEVEKIIGSEKEKEYRNKLEFTFSNKRYRTKEELEPYKTKEEIYALPNEPALGFHVPKLFDKIIQIETCYLMQEPTNAIRNEIFRFAVEKEYTFYDIKNRTGWLRNLMLRIATTGEIMLNVIMAHDNIDKEELLQHIATTFPEITALLYTINPKLNDTIYDLEPQVYKGNAYIVEHLETFKFKISTKSFFQTNTKQAEKLYQITREYAELTGIETVYDLYCGTGSIGIFCSKNAKKIIGVELIEDAIINAKANAKLNNIEHADFFAGDVIDICKDTFFATHGKADVIITDPPRAGMHPKLVEKILEMKAPIVVYVSCNSATQARDLQLLDVLYKVTKVQPVDMFPHTHHIENVVQLKLKK
jgi:23S rRNA (uracil1939-C5)-methyltransferase